MKGSLPCSVSGHAVPPMGAEYGAYAAGRLHAMKPREGETGQGERNKARLKMPGAYAAVVEKVAVAASVVCSPSELMPKTMTTYSVDASRPSKSSRLRPAWV